MIAAETPFRPPAPVPRRTPPDMFEFLAALRANPLTTWTEDHFEHLILAGEGALGRITIVHDPAAIRHVLVDNAANYRKDDLQRRVLAPGLGNGLLTAEGEEWRLQRRTLAPLFAPRHVAGFVPAMIAAGGAAGAALAAARRPHPRCRPRDDARDARRARADDLHDRAQARSRMRSGARSRATSRRSGRSTRSTSSACRSGCRGSAGWRARPALRFFEEVVGELIDTRRALLARGEPSPNDLLTLLLQAADPETGRGLTDVEVRANIVTFIGAGHETTANALTWSLYLLSQAPAARERIEAEVDAVMPDGVLAPEALPRLVFTKAVVEEAMRLYPPVPYMSRAALGEDRIGNLKIPRGSMVTIAPWVLHRHRRLWDDPDAFVPERFLPERRDGIDRFAYLPFGAGPRVCIGASFSLQEAVIVLASAVRAARFSSSRGTRSCRCTG